ncbi:carbonic anhydrase [Roseomonas sp. GC11]|uniref:carbonic anhydrase n=1 Tax=Roseomonas sp. GC11 TaxID=2950546 RepID=UPI0021088798|nr:carbonic anhydrase [Roseomonas sp. GC11]MCQ4161788.1 carbonic anhydrase [Roseomonas sp. GC11]
MTQLSRRHLGGMFCAACAAVALAPFRPARAAGGLPKTELTPAQALARLQEGNRRFVADDATRPDISAARRHALSGGQAPFAAILGCADSRVSPELTFSAGLGEVFVTRVAGNTLSPTGLGSLEYSVLALGVPLVVVLGHAKCGAVGAALEVAEKGAALPGALEPMVDPILAAVPEARAAGGDLLDQTVRAHARRTARRLREGESSLAPLVKDGKLRVAAAYYNLEDGKVEWLEG